VASAPRAGHRDPCVGSARKHMSRSTHPALLRPKPPPQLRLYDCVMVPPATIYLLSNQKSSDYTKYYQVSLHSDVEAYNEKSFLWKTLEPAATEKKYSVESTCALCLLKLRLQKSCFIERKGFISFTTPAPSQFLIFTFLSLMHYLHLKWKSVKIG
jgi:hypothetical protein